MTYGSRDGSFSDDGSALDAAEGDTSIAPLDAAAFDGPTSVYDGPIDPDAASCDRDKDGYLAGKAGCDAGGATLVDCDDLDKRAHPGEPDFLTDIPSPTLLGDWNCNGVIEPQYAAITCGTNCTGYGFGAAEGCGASGPYVMCTGLFPVCTPADAGSRTQGCK